jgi:hypothetical protein
MGSPSVTHTQAAAHLKGGFPVKKGETATHDLEVSSRLCASRQDGGNPCSRTFRKPLGNKGVRASLRLKSSPTSDPLT